MHPLPAALALGAALLLTSARPGHAGDAAVSRDARDAASSHCLRDGNAGSRHPEVAARVQRVRNGQSSRSKIGGLQPRARKAPLFLIQKP